MAEISGIMTFLAPQKGRDQYSDVSRSQMISKIWKFLIDVQKFKLSETY